MSEDFYGALMQRRAIANTVDLATITAPGIYPVDTGNATAPGALSGTLLVYLPTAKYKQEFIPDSGFKSFRVNGEWTDLKITAFTDVQTAKDDLTAGRVPLAGYDHFARQLYLDSGDGTTSDATKVGIVNSTADDGSTIPSFRFYAHTDTATGQEVREQGERVYSPNNLPFGLGDSSAPNIKDAQLLSPDATPTQFFYQGGSADDKHFNGYGTGIHLNYPGGGTQRLTANLFIDSAGNLSIEWLAVNIADGSVVIDKLQKLYGPLNPPPATDLSAYITTSAADTKYQLKNTVSKAANGWFKDTTTGMIIQWGYTENASNGVTFPIAFPSTCASMTLADAHTRADYSITISTLSATSATFNSENNGNLYWIAIGY